nr:hypothetical protein [Tanacetum cinerariifolium]
MQNPKDSPDPTTTMNTTLALLAKAFKVNTIPTNNNQKGSLIPCNNQIAQPGMNTSQDIKMQMVDNNIAQKEEARIQSTQKEFKFMDAADAYKETERVKVNCTSEDTLQQASTSETQSDNALVYDLSYDHDIFNMLTHKV